MSQVDTPRTAAQVRELGLRGSAASGHGMVSSFLPFDRFRKMQLCDFFGQMPSFQHHIPG